MVKRLKRLSEGRMMWVSVMTIFVVYVTVLFLFEDFDRKSFEPLDQVNGWHLLVFSLVVLLLLGWLLHHYAVRMDERITRQQQEKEARMRRELTQNISHELKTPVASILGYTDTLLENPDIAPQMRDQFIARTNAQAHRLSALLQDLSTLNKMDYAPEMLSRQPVDVSSLVADIVQESELTLEARKMTLKNNLPEGITIVGNEQLLYGIFRNLIDNSINYSGIGTAIELSAVRQPDGWHFTFCDNGIGVPTEHLPRLFERFYRVDKGRSRSMGGTGLGLAIVKNAVIQHGGQIRASSSVGQGLRFDFNLCS